MKTARVMTAVAGLALTAAANAQFSGPYAPANWTTNVGTGFGSVNTALAPASITVIGNNGGGANINTDYTIAAAAAGNWSFSWSIISADTGTWDSAYYLLNGAETFIGNNTASGFGGAFGPIAVNAGDVIGFRVRAADGGIGALELTISNFVAPVPGPGSLALLGMGGLAMARRRRR